MQIQAFYFLSRFAEKQPDLASLNQTRKCIMNIYVGNLSPATTEEELRKSFERFGEVDSVSIIKDKSTGQSRGFGFVELPETADGQEAIAGLNSTELDGNVLIVNEARSRGQRSDRRERHQG